MALLEVRNLSKSYPGFRLQSVSFDVERAGVTGLIGLRGAGKTTTLKSILGLVRPDAGSVRCFGMDGAAHGREIREFIGFAAGGTDFYPRKRIRDIAAAARAFYGTWDDRAYRRYLTLFSLDEKKTPAQLSRKRRIELGLVLALSHKAELLILDEPTAGLDVAARAELADAFKYVRAQRVAILFSTSAAADLERCADSLVYLRGGELVAAEALGDFLAFHRMQGGGTLEEILRRYERGPWDGTA